MALPPPPPPPPPEPFALPPDPFAPPTRAVPRGIAVLGIGIVALVLLGMVAVVLRLAEDDGPPHPDEWDPRVEAIAEFVERERGHEFDHPVYVDFLSPEEYTEIATGDAGGLTDADRVDLDRYAGELRALGVGTGEIDLFDAYNQVADAGTLAFYDPTDERVRVRGTTMTPGLEVTLAHELTHALQDQTFDLDALEEAEDAAAATAFRSLVEGDAMRIDEAYRTQELTEAEQDVYDDEYAGEIDRSEEATADVPDYVEAGFQIPYALGSPFVAMLDNVGGNDRIDAAFGEPPTTGEHLFDPASYLAGEDQAEVDLGVDEEDVFDGGSLGPTDWYLILAERIDPKQAFEAALGWNGDAYAAYEQDGATCVTGAFVGDTAGDEEEMAAALDAWAAAMPGGQAEAVEIDGHPGFESCDPGEDVDMELTSGSTAALFLPSLWGFLEADAAQQLGADEVRCYAGEVVDGLTFEEITDPDGAAFDDEDFQDDLVDAFESCTGA